jgi:hypothetical protein
MRKFFTITGIIAVFLLPVMLYAQEELDENLLSNWEFDNGEEGWSFVINADAEAAHFWDEDGLLSGPSSLRWEIVSGGVNFWDIQTYQTAPIEEGVEYFIDFLVYYESTDNLDVTIKWELAGDPYTGYHQQSFNLTATSEVHRLQSTFTSTYEDPTANLKFFCGNPNAEVEVWMDRMYVGEYPLDDLTGIEDQTPMNQRPVSFELMQNYPNPFNPATQISYSLKEQAQVTLQVFNQLGQLVNTLQEGSQSSGTYTVQWNGLDVNGIDVASGVYIVKMQAVGKSQVFTDFIKAIKIK